MTRLLAPAFLGLLLVGGCASQPGPRCDMGAAASQRDLVDGPEMANGDTAPLREAPVNSVSVIDQDILHKVVVRSIASARTGTGTVEVVAEVVNCTDYPLTLEGRTQFYTAANTPAEAASAWQRFHLSPHGGGTYRELSLGDKAVDGYRVEIRETK